jgi:hypothetical protein
MRSLKNLDKYLKINNCNFQIIKKIGGNWVVNFNQMYLGYYPVNGNDVLRRLPGKFTAHEDREYMDTIGGEYWFFGLNPAERECAYLITEYNGGSLKIDTDLPIRLEEK